MKCVLVLFAALFCAANGYPQRIFVPLSANPFVNYGEYPFEPARRHRDLSDESSAADETAPAVFDPTYGRADDSLNPYYFADIMTQMRDMMVRLKQEMNELLRRYPTGSDESGTDTSLFSIGGTDDIDLSNAQNKTTSKTEVIDGQVYVVNETIIRSGNEDSGSILRVKTIQLKPAESGTSDESVDTPSTPVPQGSVTSTPLSTEVRNKNEDNNEIPNEAKIRFSEWDSSELVESVPQQLNEIDNSVDVETFELPESFKPIDLSQDILVNKYMSDQETAQGLVLIDPDAELIDVNNGKANDYYRYDNLRSQPEAPLERLKDESMP